MNDHNESDSEIDHGKTGRPPMQPRAKATREAILEASATLFSKTGYAGTTIDDIVTLAQYPNGCTSFQFYLPPGGTWAAQATSYVNCPW